MTNEEIHGYTITAVERDTGLSKDVLRMWERRYGFPAPQRDKHGERVYSNAELEQLRLIKRLINKGFRPGKLLATLPTDLVALLADTTLVQPEQVLADWEVYLEPLRQGDIPSLHAKLQQQLLRQGLRSFVLDTAAPLTFAVGEAWMRGQLRVHEEHIYSELLKSLLRQSMPIATTTGSPTLLLTTLPDEEHGLGLLMAEALFVLEGARCIALGTRTPISEIVDAAQKHGADSVALSFTPAFPARQAALELRELRRQLPPSIEIWIGGGGSEHILLVDGIYRSSSAYGPSELLAAWRARQL